MAMGSDQPGGTLYRLDTDHALHAMQSGVYISNGLGWSLDNRTMYYSDTGEHKVWAYDFDPATGAIENRRAFITVPEEPGEGAPDGLTVDSEGFIWLARWGGWQVVRYDPDGNIERRVKVPAARITSVMFGGPHLDELYITSARMDHDESTEPHAGSIFRYTPGVTGLPEAEYGG
jgi:sugar lactone lactonase YvrE